MTTVLVVDDSASEMARLKAILYRHDFEVIEANNGALGVQMAIDFLPDVILMDIVMPEMNGFQATRRITRNKKTSHIPVIMISAKNQESDRVWGKRQGSKAYLSKPVDEDELIKTIVDVMEK